MGKPSPLYKLSGYSQNDIRRATRNKKIPMRPSAMRAFNERVKQAKAQHARTSRRRSSRGFSLW